MASTEIADAQFMASMMTKLAGFMNQMSELCIKKAHENQAPRLKEKQKQKKDKIKNKMKDKSRKKYARMASRLPLEIQQQRPKAPTSSFLIFYHQSKARLSKIHGQNNSSALTKIASNQWKNMIPEKKAQFQKRSQVSKKRYQKQMQAFKAKYADQINEATKQRNLQYRTTWMMKKKAIRNQQQQKSLSFSEHNQHKRKEAQSSKAKATGKANPKKQVKKTKKTVNQVNKK